MKDPNWMSVEAGNSWFDRFQTQRNRRFIAALYLATLAALLLITWFVDSYWPLVPLFALFSINTVLLYGSTRGIVGLPTQSLDEQQIAVRNAGYKITYSARVVVAFFGGFAVSKITDWDTAFEAGLILAVWGLLTGLPMLAVAWTLPGETVDEN